MKRTLALAVVLASMIAATAGAARAPGFYWQHAACTYKSGVVTCTNLGPQVVVMTRRTFAFGVKGHPLVKYKRTTHEIAYGPELSPGGYQGVLCTFARIVYSEGQTPMYQTWAPSGPYIRCTPDTPSRSGYVAWVGNDKIYLSPGGPFG